MADQNFPSPSPAFRGPSQSPPKNLFDTAAKWCPKGLNLPPAATLALYAGRLVNKETGESYSAEEFAALLANVKIKYVTSADAPEDTYVLSAEDNGKIILLDVADATTVGIPMFSAIDRLPVEFNAAVIQWGAGTLTYAVDAGVLRSAGGLVASAEQYSAVSVAVVLPQTVFLSGSLA